MELGSQIKKYRTEMDLSQEELAEKVYVTRQTISNWENDKSYPDIHSLILLSSLFNVSVDQLIKGDVEIMKKEITKTEIGKFYQYAAVYSILLAATILSVIPVLVWPNVYVIACVLVLYGVTIYFAFKVERLKKDNNVHTYKEIVAFMNGKRLDEMEQQQEKGKRPYQQFLLALGCAVIVIIIVLVVHIICR